MTMRHVLLATALVLTAAVTSADPGGRDERPVASPADAVAPPSVDEPSPSSPPADSPVTISPDPSDDVGIDGVAFGQDVVEALGDRLPDVAARNGLDEQELLDVLEDPSVGVDSSGAIFVAEAPHDEEHDEEHADEAEGAGPEGAADPGDGSPQTAQALAAPLDQTFALNSKPGSQRTIYLDFDGHDVTDTQWNRNHGVPAGFHRGFSLDGDYATFSTQERTVIQQVWQQVAEDFAPFDVNVTTQDPGDAAITRAAAYDQVYGARALISDSPGFPTTCGSGCAGIAYVGVLNATQGHRAYQTAWIKTSAANGSAKRLADVISHEIGHNGGLYHAGTTTSEYYSGLQHWGPIMGSPYIRAVTQWASADYPNANRPGQPDDDLTVFAQNGLVARPDEPGTSPSNAPPIPAGAPTGFITSRTDVDVWAVGRCGGGATVTATPAPRAPNLDIGLTLIDASGRVLASANPVSGQTSVTVATGMDAKVSIPGASSALFVRVEGVGLPGVYSDYGSLGAYTLTAQCRPSVFTDVAGTHVFFRQIEWMAERGISTGYPNGDGTDSYRPADAVLREQMAAFLARFAGVEGSLTPPTRQQFTDVPVTATFARHITWLAGAKISTGYPDGSFRPGQPVLREQMAAFLHRLAGSPATTTSCRFSDVPANHVFRAQICWLSSTGITTGYTDGTFRPGQPVLREQMAAFLFRFDERKLLP